VESPKAQSAPKVESPKAQSAPKVESPKAKNSQSAPKVESPKVESPKAQSVPKVESPPVTKPRKVQVIPENRNDRISKYKQISKHRKEEIRYKFCTYVNTDCAGRPYCLVLETTNCFLLPNGDSIKLNVETITAGARYYQGISNCDGHFPHIYLNSTYTCVPNLSIDRSYKVVPFITFDNFYTQKH